MPDFHVQLTLEWFQAQSTVDRTEAKLASIAAHVCETHALSPEETARVQAEALVQAQRRFLLRSTP